MLRFVSLTLALSLCPLCYTIHVILCGTVHVSLCGTVNCVFPKSKNIPYLTATQ